MTNTLSLMPCFLFITGIAPATDVNTTTPTTHTTAVNTATTPTPTTPTTDVSGPQPSSTGNIYYGTV